MADPNPTAGERRTEPTTDSVSVPATTNRTLRWGASLLALSGAGILVNGLAMLYRVFFTDGFEAGVETLGGLTRSDLAAINHEVVHYIDHLHVNVAGLMVAVGIAVLALSWFGVRRGQRWAWGTAVALPVVFLGHSLPIHGAAAFRYDALAHLGPGILWVPTLIVGAVVSASGLRSIDRSADGRPE